MFPSNALTLISVCPAGDEKLENQEPENMGSTKAINDTSCQIILIPAHRQKGWMKQVQIRWISDVPVLGKEYCKLGIIGTHTPII